MDEKQILQTMEELLKYENDYYKVLGISKNADSKTIKIAYRKMCMKYHPDKLITYSEKVQSVGQEVMTLINKVYNTLSNEQYKVIYDQQGIDINNLNTVKKTDIPENDARIKELFKDILEFKDVSDILPTFMRVEKVPLKTALFGGKVQLKFDCNDSKHIKPNELYVLTVNIPPFTNSMEMDFADACIKSIPMQEGEEIKSMRVNINLLLQITNNSKIKLKGNDILFKITNKKFDMDKTKSIKILGKPVSLEGVKPEITTDGILYKGLGVRDLITGEYGNLILTR